MIIILDDPNVMFHSSYGKGHQFYEVVLVSIILLS